MSSPDPPASPLDAPVPAPPALFEHPSRIGPYRVLRVLGEGGMGVVYLAEQTEPVHREVALKILKLGMDTRQVVARFESERQALAVMEHPSISKVYDAGATERGRPYFVMERVDGVPVTEYCDAHGLSVRERVRLFLQVCRAVQHAHQKGVIHRDLKPSNVLVTVTTDGEPLCKVIDFGIAKATEQDAAGHTALTQADQMMGTPAYMSPEQVEASGLDVDTRADVYSLGVLLYQLLAGTLPFDSRAYQGWGFVAQHLVREPPAPSARLAALEAGEQARIAGLRGTDPRGLRRELRTELDWIVLRAMEKDRDRRYETANGLALELERYLAHEPVLAGPPSRAYRVRKFVRRNRVGVGFASVLSLLLVAFAASVAVQNQRIAQARDLAEARQGQAEDLIGFMLGDLWQKLEPVGRLEILADVGDRAVAYFARVDPGQLSDDELGSRSRMLYNIGSVRMRQGSVPEAIRAFEESLRLARELSERAPADTARLYQLAQSHFWVGYAAYRHGRHDAAEREFRGYLAAAERLVGLDPDNLDYRMELGYAHSNLGSVREARGDIGAAIESFSRTLQVKQDLVRRDSARVDWLGELAETHNTLAVAYHKAGQYDRALQEHRREFEIKTAVVAREPAHAYWRYRLSVARSKMGILETVLGNLDGAVEHYRTAAKTADSLLVHDPSNAAWRRDAAATWRLLGVALGHRGERAESSLAFRRSRELLQALVHRDSAGFDWKKELGLTHTAEARMLLEFREPTAALQAAERGRELLAGEEPPLAVARVENQIVRAQALRSLGRGAEAREILRQALELAHPLAQGVEYTEVQPLLAEIYLGLDRAPDARRILEDLRRRGYREPGLMRQARSSGLVPQL